MKSQDKSLEFHKVGVIGILFISIMIVTTQLFIVRGEVLTGYVYSKSLSLDYFTISNAHDYLKWTCIYEDYIYIVNETKLQKISLLTSLVEDEIQWIQLSSVSEFMRKGNRLFIDATIDATRTIICIDIETFSELAQVQRLKFSPEFTRGLENIEYFDCNDHDIWVWASANSTNTDNGRLYPNVYRGRYVYNPLGLNLDMEWCFISGFQHVTIIGAGADFMIYQYMYNASSDTVDYFEWNKGATTANYAHWFSANSYFNYLNDTWVSSFGLLVKHSPYLGGNSPDQMNIQYDYRDNEQWLDVTWGEWGVRDNPNVDDDPSTDIYQFVSNIWMDTDDRVFRYQYKVTPYRTFIIARFDKTGFITWISGKTIDDPVLVHGVESWGTFALGRYVNPTYGKRTWLSYVNHTDKFPKAEFVLEVGGTENREAGTVEFEYPDVTDSKVYMASMNFVAIFTIASDEDNLYVCRNLIDRNLLSSGGYTTPTLQFLDATLYTVIGNTRVLNDGWLFMGEIYQLESTFSNMTYYYLELDDGENTLRFYWNNETKSLNITQSEQFLGGLIDSSIETVNETLRQYTVTWTFILNRNIVDIEGVSITYYGYNELEEHYIDDVAITGLNIYNLGGLTYYEFEGDGGKTPYGTPFELYATNGSLGSSARAEQIFRKLQSVHFLMELDMANEWDVGGGYYDIDAGVGYVDIGFDYRLDGTWIEGFKIRLYVQDADVGHHNGGNDQNWIEWSADFYNYNPEYSDVVNLKSQLIYSNHWGYEHENFEPDYHNRTSAQLWIDLWFDRTNASTTVATQINSYYYGMSEQGSAWWFGYGTFQPMISDYDNAKFLDNLYDENGEISNSQKIELVKFWIEVSKVNIADGNDEKWSIKGIEDMNREQAIDRMMGVDEPTFVQTKVLDMPQTGFINALKTAINNLSVTIWLGALQFIKILMSSIGYLMNAIGLGVWWESFSIMLGNIATASLAFMDDLTIALLNSALLIEQITRLITNGVTRYVYVITAFITSIIGWYGYIIQMFSGGGIFNIDIWTSLNLEDIFILLMHLSPVWWINRLNESDHFIETLQGDLRFIIMLVTGLFNFLASIIIVTMTLINILLGMLPI